MKKLYLLLTFIPLFLAIADESLITNKKEILGRSQPIFHSVYDTSSTLLWEDTPLCATQQLTWSKAIEYCEALDLDDHQDWRLPNIFELSSINVTLENWGESQQMYWSSTTYAGAGAMVYLNNPIIAYRNRYTLGWGDKANIRCVTGGILP